MKPLQFAIDINAPKETVWTTLWQDEAFRAWAGFIDPGTYLKGELQEGNEVEFISKENGYGVTSLVEKLIKNELLILRHTADTKETGAKKREKEWSGGAEIYTLQEQGDITTLTISFDAPEEMAELLKVSYPKALHCIKELTENSRS